MRAKIGLALGVLMASAMSVAVDAQTADKVPAQGAQQAQAAAGSGKCAIQHEAQPGVSAAGLLADNYEIRASVPGGLWLQKQQDAFYCNAGIVAEGDTMCWKLVRPTRTESCTEVRRQSSARQIGS
ncbi:MAG: hypothetical protein ACOY4R_00850 [Pseudomonadota bacterium]